MKHFSRNAFVLVVTVVVHIVVFIGVARVRLTPPRIAPEYHTTWITIGGDKPIVVRTRKKLQLRPADSRPIEKAATAPLAPVAIASIDWRAQGEQAASAVATRGTEDAATRSLPTLKGIEQDPIPEDAVSLFPAPLHKNGDTQRFDGAELITWISDKCYATNLPFGAPQLDGNALHVVCKDPFANRRDLFDHLKPKYLQAAPGENVDQPAAARTCSYSTFRCK